MDGKRNLSVPGVAKVAHALRLNQHESEFLENLVLFNQAVTADEKNRYYAKMIRSRKYRELRKVEERQFEYFSRWYYPAVRELTLLSDFREDPVWIASRLIPAISTQEAEKALELLQELQLLKRNKKGRLEPKTRVISSGDEVKSLAVKNFHTEMLKIAAVSMDHTPSEERDISGVMLNLSKSRISEVKEKIQRFRKELIADVCSFEDRPEEIYELNVQFFPLSRKKEKE